MSGFRHYFSGPPFDRVLIPRGDDAEEFMYLRQYINRSADPAAHKQFISDHYMIVSPIRVTDDDDQDHPPGHLR